MIDDPVKLLAAVAAVALFVAPYIPAAFSRLMSLAKSVHVPTFPAAPSGIGVDDMTTVLHLANKLRLEGNTEAVALCQQLLDAMLGHKPGGKK